MEKVERKMSPYAIRHSHRSHLEIKHVALLRSEQEHLLLFTHGKSRDHLLLHLVEQRNRPHAPRRSVFIRHGQIPYFQHGTAFHSGGLRLHNTIQQQVVEDPRKSVVLLQIRAELVGHSARLRCDVVRTVVISVADCI